jgi:DNA modification methylase
MDIYSDILKPYIAQQKATFRNLITWSKGGFGSGGGTGVGQAIQRSYFPGDEKCLFIMLGIQGFNNNSDNYFEGFEPIRNWLIKEKEKSGLRNEEITKLTATTHTHYWSKSQWAFPTKEHYNTIKDAANGQAFLKEYEEIKKEYEEIKKEWYSSRAYFDNTHDMMTNVWEFARHRRDGTEGKHSTPKPIPLCERAIKSSCPDGGLVIDFFLGSGSTMVASHQLKRKCYGMELDCRYADVIVKRMIKLDPTLTVKRNGVLTNDFI